MKTENNLPPKAGIFPKRITLELTNSCNLSCTFCPRRLMEKDLGFLDTILAKKLIDEMADHLPVAMVPFFRGEPLLHPDWSEIMAYAKKKGIGPIQLTTNATLMTDEVIDTILALGIDFISFSMDTTDQELYEKSRRGADYQTVLNNILTLLEKRDSRGLELPTVQISAVSTPLHKPGLRDFISFWESKADLVRVYIEHSQDGYPGSISEPLPEFSRRLPCHKPFTDMVVYWNGEVALCNHDWTRGEGTRMGNVGTIGISGVWTSERYEQIRTIHKNGELSTEELCLHCDHWKMYYLPDGYLGEIHRRKDEETK